MVDKPPHGATCNACGLCCVYSICPLGQQVFGLIEIGAAVGQVVEGPCPALERTGETFGCGVVIHPGRWAPVRTARYGAQRMREAAKVLVGVGVGCDAHIEGELYDHGYNEKMKAGADKRAAEVIEAMKLWGLR